jgi:hypothetical protein
MHRSVGCEGAHGTQGGFPPNSQATTGCTTTRAVATAIAPVGGVELLQFGESRNVLRDAALIGAFIESARGSAWVNRERMALQASGCANGVVAVHIPLSSAVLTAVESALAQSSLGGGHGR